MGPLKDQGRLLLMLLLLWRGLLRLGVMPANPNLPIGAPYSQAFGVQGCQG